MNVCTVSPSVYIFLLLLFFNSNHPANMEEKTDFGHQAEHVETNSIDANEEKQDLSKVQTLAVVDVENRAAFKGDESDGKVEWNFKTLAAATFLCMLYTGRS